MLDKGIVDNYLPIWQDYIEVDRISIALSKPKALIG